MAVAFDAVSSTTAATASATSLTYAHTCGGSDRLLIVGVSVAFEAALTITSVTYAGTGMTLVTWRASNDGNSGYVAMYRLIAPAAGTANVIVSLSGAQDIISGSVSFTGVHQTTPLGTAATAIGTASPISVAVTGTTTGNMVIDAACNGNNFISSGQTMRTSRNLNTASAAGNFASSTAAGNGSGVTMSYSVTDDWHAILAVEVLAAAGGGATVTPAVVAAVAAVPTAGLSAGSTVDSPTAVVAVVATPAATPSGAAEVTPAAVAAVADVPAVTVSTGGGDAGPSLWPVVQGLRLG